MLVEGCPFFPAWMVAMAQGASGMSCRSKTSAKLLHRGENVQPRGDGKQYKHKKTNTTTLLLAGSFGQAWSIWARPGTAQESDDK